MYVLEWSEIRDEQDDGTAVMVPFISARVQYYEVLDHDWDGDGVFDSLDLDDDNDGVNDTDDGAPFDPAISFKDSDFDGIANSDDPDDDNDGFLDEEDAFPTDPLAFVDSDQDGIADVYDTDFDNDGVDNLQDIAPYNEAIQHSQLIASDALTGIRFGYAQGARDEPRMLLGINFGAWQFNPDGTGTAMTQWYSHAMTWINDSDVISVNFTDDVNTSYPGTRFASC